ncbi:MAG: PilZ domain-containing protein [Chitinispirillaceae bacterium]|nr:PilZ domain-containing protein [Chitinispirillaceae bacterium]
MSFVQREHYRVPIEAPVVIQVNDEPAVEATCLNISMGGMGLSVPGVVAPKSSGMVRMTYQQENGQLLFSAKFSVAWSRSKTSEAPAGNTGIQFLGIDEQNRNNLVRIIIKRLRELEGSTTDTG